VVNGLGVGSRVANYRITAPLGHGGMGSVWLGIDEILGREVALKVLSEELAGYPDLRLRFIRESKAAAMVDHSNIIPVYSAGEWGGRYYIAMRYVNGGDLRALLARQGPLPPSRAVAIIRAVASALDAAHAAGLMHGDVKPGNMLLHSRAGDDPEVYLADFGLASFVADPTSPGGLTFGTPGFIAPEVLRREPADGRADQWALACSAFVMLSGSNPFAGLSSDAFIESLLRRPPALTARCPELPPAVDEVLARAMDRHPGPRFATCLDFALALRGAMGRSPGQLATRKPTEIPLRPGFRYVQEPYRGDGTGFDSLGNDRLVDELENRIRHSVGGTFLITGFRGVGKTSLVLRALDKLTTRCRDAELVVPVVMSVARSTTTQSLLFAIVRRIYETLKDLEVLERLPPQAREELHVAYARTLMTLKETRSDSQQGSIGVGTGTGPSFTATRGNSDTIEGEFLPYSEGDAEHALMRILTMIGGKPVPQRTRQRRLGPRRLAEHALIRIFTMIGGKPVPQRTRQRRLGPRRPAEQPQCLRLVVVLDEVDKLTAEDAGMATIEDLLRGTRNVLTMSGAHFLVVGGPDMHDRAARDARRGHEIHRSVFGCQLYVPCIWDAARRYIADITSGSSAGDLDEFVNYLSYKARGIPRLLLQEVSDFVTWADDDRPQLRIPGQVTFYARLERVIGDFVVEHERTGLLRDPLAADRWRLGSYYAVDWVLRSEGLPFTTAELLQDGGEAQFDPLLGISSKSVGLLLDHLARSGILRVVREEQDPGTTVISDVTGAADKVFRLSDHAFGELYGLAGGRDLAPTPVPEPGLAAGAASPSDIYQEPRSARTVRVDRDLTPAAAAPAADHPGEPADSKLLIGGKYVLDRLLSQGALGGTYRAHEICTRRQVSVKVLRGDLAGDDIARARFRREAEILKRLDHPQVVRTIDTVGEPGPDAIVMEPLIGSTLEELVRDDGPLQAREVTAIGQILAGALHYIADEQVVRLDLKPANIIMADRGPVIASLGIAFPTDEAAEDALSHSSRMGMIGTPTFMAPEMVMCATPDPRADIYALGLVMYFCLAGRTPWQDLTSITAVLRAITHQPIDVARLPATPDFRSVIARATARDRDDRFPDAGALREALLATPEWRSLNGG
jgi:serine/threonine-protein kinase